jgi:hypothetical protein
MAIGIGNSSKPRKAEQKAAKSVAKNLAQSGKRPGPLHPKVFEVGKGQYRAVVRAASKPTPKQQKAKKKSGKK